MAARLVRLGLLLVLNVACAFSHAEQWPDAQWSRAPVVATPALGGLESYAFPARDEVERKGVRSDALLVIRDGQIVYERYAGVTGVNTPHLTWSVSKSVLATLLGVAFGEGRLRLQDPVARFYPPFKAHPDVTLADLLHWSSGLDWQEDYEYAPLNSSVVAMLYTRGRQDMAGFTASHAKAWAPGTAWRYSSGDSNVLAAALKGMVGEQAYPDYPWTALFEPLGISSAVWERDASGTFVGSSYLYMTARDLARIGLLMQRSGRWQQRQLVPQAWVDFVLAPFAGHNAEAGSEVIGGHWWLNRTASGAAGPWPQAPADTFAALGHWGQALYVIPSAGLVVVRYGDDRDGSYQHAELLNHVLAAFGPQARP
ncbi:beta-lactamase family protein [Pseudomonas sp. 21LCFQ02]|uniref:serine hydrolase domain-containing protein n=1 Tax=unclassified Pseudomonas TaxID=196821 RepID=UPI0005F09C9B|nr:MULTISPECIES: serine hydrolase [unclassified Pseudomonas]MCO8166540.1 beta-lactamase family protein [Pseudomonas sp. 21LCFQ02]